MGVLTVGVHGFDGASFVRTLRRAGVAVLVDVRQRRAVRGAQYAWANARRLQALLAEAGIDYRHRRDLAPTTELRELQYADDARRGVGKRSRRALAPEYSRRYVAEILDHVEVTSLASMADEGAVALLCVERDAAACHRSLITQRLAERHHVEIAHLRVPPG